MGEMLHGTVMMHHARAGLCIRLLYLKAPAIYAHNALCIRRSTQFAISSAYTQPAHALSLSYYRTVLRHQTLLSLPPLQPCVLSSSCQRERGNEDKIRPGYLLGLPSI